MVRGRWRLRQRFSVGALALAVASASAGAYASESAPAPPDDDGGASVAEPRQPPVSKESVLIRSKPWLLNRETRYAHSLPEVDGPILNVTKKTSVVRLEDQPAVIDNNQREIFDRLPGIVLAEQQNPTQLNLSYRGLGNPQESEFVLMLQDGLPLELDWIGFPTLYYLPVPQTLTSVQMIRAGSGLLYGPEPQPVINFVSRRPDPARAFGGTTQQVGGSHDLWSSFNAVSGTVGDWDYLADYSHRQSKGERVNGDYHVNSGDFTVGYRLDGHQKLSVDFHAYSVESGLAGLMSGTQFHADPNQTTTPDDREWTDRYTAALTYENRFDDRNELVQKIWTGYTDLVTRSGNYAPGATTAATLASQRFHYTGLDGRLLHRWGRGNALTLGYTAYLSRSPQTQFATADRLADRDDESGTRTYSNQRRTGYAALFAENVFRFPLFHLVTSARLDHQEIKAHESIAVRPNLGPVAPNLVDATYRKNIPLFGIGIGNDFGTGNETYLNVSQGFRPLRYLDVASPFTNYSTGNNPDPTHYVTYEAGVHGWPVAGFYYDASVFQVDVHDRIEARQASPTETVDVNTGNTRNRGVELEASFDLLHLWPEAATDRHLDLFANGSYLHARFTDSRVPSQIGRTPAYAPDYVVKAGLTLRRDRHYKVSVVLDSVDSQFFQDSNQPIATTPARIPGYTLLDVSGELTVAGRLRVLGGIANLTDRRYYSRVFIARGLIEPGRERTFNAGLAYDF